MIPAGITREHVIKAIGKINASGVPSIRKSKAYDLIYEDRRYPPKYLISVAVGVATGEELAPDEFNAGKNETNPFLEELGFDIEKKK